MSRAILFALHREAAPFLRRFPRLQRVRSAPCPAWQGESLLILETGVGPDRCLAALRWLLDSDLPRPCEVISAGFAGALEAGWSIGDVMLADEIVDEAGQLWRGACPAWRGRRGRLLTLSRLAGDPDVKRQLGLKHCASAVEMESAAVAQFCHEHDMAFAGVRAISDDVATSLSPRLVSLLGGASVSISRLLWGLLQQPGMIRELWRLARDTRQAANRLADALMTLLEEKETRRVASN